MPSALEHLKVAKRYHFQGLTNEAIREYEAVLEIDPDNGDAIAGLRALGVEPTMRDDMQDGAVGHAGGLKTNFFTNQSKGSTSGGVTGKVFSYIVMALGIGGLYGLYVLAMYLMNYDNVTAKENVEVHFEKPKVKDNNAVVNVEVINLNPAPIKHMLNCRVRFLQATGALLLKHHLAKLKEFPQYLSRSSRPWSMDRNQN
jgi:hypothetical protein